MDGPLLCDIKVWPAPRIDSVLPAIGITAGGTVITIVGQNLLTIQGVAPQILIGQAACDGIVVLSSSALCCSVPSGTGFKDLTLIVAEESIQRVAVVTSAFVQSDLIFGGNSNSMKGVVAAGPFYESITIFNNTRVANLTIDLIPILENQEIFSINTILSYNHRIILGGQFALDGDSVFSYIAFFNGKSLQSLGFNFDGAVTSFAVFQEKFFVGGTFTSGHDLSWPLTESVVQRRWAQTFGLAVWDGKMLLPLNITTPMVVKELLSSESTLYVAGFFSTSGQLDTVPSVV